MSFLLNDNSIELILAIDLPSGLGVLEVGGEKVIDAGVSIQFKNTLFNDIIISYCYNISSMIYEIKLNASAHYLYMTQAPSRISR